MLDTAMYALWGIIFGFLVSAPIGPINILCMRRALYGRARDGFYIGLGAAVGDAFYAALAAFGLNAVYELIEAHETLLVMVGGIIMAGFALHIWRDTPHLDTSSLSGKVKRSAMATLMVTLTNPGVFVGFLALYTLAGIGDLGAGDQRAYVDAAFLTGGVFVGSALWWAFFAAATKKFKTRFNDKFLSKINHVSAGFIGIFAIAALATAITKFISS
jgi:threonine/homoserine/homoserine lactone efflux protein